jgi:hypothetical protein
MLTPNISVYTITMEHFDNETTSKGIWSVGSVYVILLNSTLMQETGNNLGVKNKALTQCKEHIENDVEELVI